MDIFFIFWLFLMIISLQPVIRQKMLESSRLRLMGKMENERKSRVIVLIHRQETMSLLGFPIMKYIDINDSEAVLRAIKMTDADTPIDIIIHTPGGLVLASEQIAKAIKKHPAKVTVFIPHYAMSGGTLIALAADEIVMDENAVLGPVDPQLGQYPAASILSVLEKKPVDKIDDNTLILRIADILSSGIFTHDYPISVEEARKIGLPVSTDMPEIVYQIMALYPQTSQRRPSVEYIPAHRQHEPGDSAKKA